MKKLRILLLCLLFSAGAIAQTTPWVPSIFVPETRTNAGLPEYRWKLGGNIIDPFHLKLTNVTDFSAYMTANYYSKTQVDALLLNLAKSTAIDSVELAGVTEFTYVMTPERAVKFGNPNLKLLSYGVFSGNDKLLPYTEYRNGSMYFSLGSTPKNVKLYVLPGIGGAGAPVVDLSAYPTRTEVSQNYLPANYDFSRFITSGYTGFDSRYLQQTGGTLQGDLNFNSAPPANYFIKSSSDDYGLGWYRNTDGMFFHFGSTGDANGTSNAFLDMFDNYYTYPTGAKEGRFIIRNISYDLGSTRIDTTLDVGVEMLRYKGKDVIHAANIYNYTVSKTGNGASGSWPINAETSTDYTNDKAAIVFNDNYAKKYNIDINGTSFRAQQIINQGTLATLNTVDYPTQVQNKPFIPSKVSEVSNDLNFTTPAAVTPLARAAISSGSPEITIDQNSGKIGFNGTGYAKTTQIPRSYLLESIDGIHAENLGNIALITASGNTVITGVSVLVTGLTGTFSSGPTINISTSGKNVFSSTALPDLTAFNQVYNNHLLGVSSAVAPNQQATLNITSAAQSANGGQMILQVTLFGYVNYN